MESPDGQFALQLDKLLQPFTRPGGDIQVVTLGVHFEVRAGIPVSVDGLANLISSVDVRT
jgi:hypothetical protein